jgi:hypothetical protein
VPSDNAPYGPATIAEVEKIKAALGSGGGRVPPVEPRPEPGDDPGMDPRIKRLEEDARETRGELKSINARLGSVEAKLASIEAKVDVLAKVIEKIPGGWQIVGMMITVMVAFAGLMGAAIQWLRPIPR